ncbi:hypothetical protein B5M10_02005 [Pluralibacter gergoviae]|nr:hypothetical protein SS31_01750 [Pluralibacter gergoviae]KMK18603.1 hypothetical protein ABW09_08490 [Pluralibacter gergoviae]OUR04603.1 hypothetical protein B5M10_02005 [Pluralibacter gergoviae]
MLFRIWLALAIAGAFFCVGRRLNEENFTILRMYCVRFPKMNWSVQKSKIKDDGKIQQGCQSANS